MAEPEPRCSSSDPTETTETRPSCTSSDPTMTTEPESSCSSREPTMREPELSRDSMEPTEAKRQCLRTDYKLCLKCQIKTKEPLVQSKFASYSKFLVHVRDRAKYGEKDYPIISKRLSGITAKQLEQENAKLHTSCYKSTTHVITLERAKKSYESGLHQQNIKCITGRKRGRPSLLMQTLDVAETSTAGSHLLRSSGEKLDKNLCFFCNKGSHSDNLGQLHQVSTVKSTGDKPSVGQLIYTAVMESNNDIWKAKVQSLNLEDLLAVDLKYHLPCYVRYVQRRATAENTSSKQDSQASIAADIEFFSLVQSLLLDKNAQLPLDQLLETYVSIRLKHGVPDPDSSKRALKRKIEQNVKYVEFARPKYKSPQVAISEKGIDDAVLQAQLYSDPNQDMKSIFRSADLIRSQILDECIVSWKFEGDLKCNENNSQASALLCTLIRWIVLGKTTELGTDQREHEINSTVSNICQSITYAVKSRRQVEYKSRDIVRGFYHKQSSENPYVVGVAFKIHSVTRSKSLVEYLHACGVSVDYTRLLRMETQLANAVLKEIEETGFYIPSGLKKGLPIFFASDNVDWNEDTADGKGTTHATIIVIFQQHGTNDTGLAAPLLTLSKSSSRSIVDMPNVMQERQECNTAHNLKPSQSIHYEEYKSESNMEECHTARLKDEVWLTARSYYRNDKRCSDVVPQNKEACTMEGDQELPSLQQDVTGQCDLGMDQPVPTWSGFNSFVSVDDTRPVTCIRTLPLINSPAHEYHTLLSVFRQTQQVSENVVGPGIPVVLTMDMDLYHRALKLQSVQPALQNAFVLRIGEFHTVLCMLRTIGSFIEGSGFEDAWEEADIYGPVTIKKVLEGKHMKRAINAHVTSLQALFDMYFESFAKTQPEISDVLKDIALSVEDLCQKRDTGTEPVKIFETVTSSWKSNELSAKLKDFNESKMKHPMFQWTMTYLDMIFTLLQFIRASREGNWLLHLQSLERFCPHFFAMNRLKYAQCVPEYIAKMYELQKSNPQLWAWFSEGNFCVKKSNVNFCKIGVDHALEQVNRSLKVLGGLTGITRKPSALTRFFLVAPEISRMADESEQLVGLAKASSRTKHHELSDPVIQRQEKNITNLRQVFERVNPLQYEEPHLINIVTQSVVPSDVQQDILNSVHAGEQAYTEFVQERITGSKSLWDKMTKVKLKSWKSVGKTSRVKIGGEHLELKEDRSLFARMAIVARSRPEMNIAEDIGMYEFSCVSRSLFSHDGNLLPCTDKSKLLQRLEMSKSDGDAEVITQVVDGEAQRILILDAMALVQELSTKPVKTCKEFASEFGKAVQTKMSGYKEAHIIFDHYDVEQSLKTSTRERRYKGDSERYHVCTDTTPIKSTFHKFISDTKTKHSLTLYLAEKLLEKFKDQEIPVVVSTSRGAKSEKLQVEHLSTSQEEADTILILHALDAVKRGMEVDIVSPDTDVFILAVSRCAFLGKNPRVILGTGTKIRKVPVQPIYEAIGQDIAIALPAFHAFTGCDTCGRFQGKGKTTCWNTLLRSPNKIREAFALLGKSPNLTDGAVQALEEFVCLIYRQKESTTTDLARLRWEMFKTSQAEAQKLPPTKAALQQHILKAAYQSLIWAQLEHANPKLPPPHEYGWQLLEDRYIPVITTLEPAPKAVIELVRCNCTTSHCSTARCTCRRARLVCTELCKCSLEDECENHSDLLHINIEPTSDSDEDDLDMV